jgi:hypothetical protein
MVPVVESFSLRSQSCSDPVSPSQAGCITGFFPLKGTELWTALNLQMQNVVLQLHFLDKRLHNCILQAAL